MMKKALLYTGAWILIWIFIWIVFNEHLPKHAHFDYFGLVSPLLLLILPFYGSQLTADAYPLIIYPGVLFWAVAILIIYIAKKKSTTGTSD
jgi:hypothetical protein